MGSGHPWEWPRGGVVTQRSAKPFTPVQFRAWPPNLLQISPVPSPAAAHDLAREQAGADRRRGVTRLAAFKAGPALLYALAREQVRSFPGSSAVEQPAVNRLVAGSNPARGAKFFKYSRRAGFDLGARQRDAPPAIARQDFSGWRVGHRGLSADAVSAADEIRGDPVDAEVFRMEMPGNHPDFDRDNRPLDHACGARDRDAQHLHRVA